jgi:hypothetical protein
MTLGELTPPDYRCCSSAAILKGASTLVISVTAGQTEALEAAERDSGVSLVHACDLVASRKSAP